MHRRDAEALRKDAIMKLVIVSAIEVHSAMGSFSDSSASLRLCGEESV